jgi:hypothetical protein
MSTREIPSQANFWERAKTNDVPIARLTGFEANDIANGRRDNRLGSPQDRQNRVDDGLEPGSLPAQLLEGIAQFVAFGISKQPIHVRSVHRAARYPVRNFESRDKGELFEERRRN